MSDVDLGGTATSINRYTNALREDRIDDFFDHAETLHATVRALQSPLIKDRRYHLKTYKQTFKGDEMVGWLVDNKHATSRVEASAIGCSLLMHGVIHHVCDDHNFKDEGLFFRFRKDDDTYKGNQRYFRQTSVEAVRLHGFLRAKFPLMIKKREYGLLSYNSCFVGSHLIDWLVDNGKCATRAAATDMGRRLQSFGFIEHVTGDHHFDDKFLYYRFYTDTLNSDRGFIEFTKLEQGLAYLGHLDRGQQLRTLPPLPPKDDVLSPAGLVDPAQLSVDGMKLEVGFHFEGSTAPPPGMRADSDSGSDGDQSPPPARRSMINRTSETLKTKKWYHSNLDRDQTVKLFQKHGRENGRWMVRDYRKRQGWYVVSVCFENEVYHIIVRHTKPAKTGQELIYKIDEGPEFESMEAVVNFYQTTTNREMPTPLVMFITKNT